MEGIVNTPQKGRENKVRLAVEELKRLNDLHGIFEYKVEDYNIEDLTTTEYIEFEMASIGFSAEGSAAIRNLAAETVRSQRMSIKRKMGRVSSMSHAIHVAHMLGILPLTDEF